LSAQIDLVLTRVRRKYKEYGIKEKPFVVVKADHGTHELGIVTVRDSKDTQALSDRVKVLAQGGKKPLLPHDFMVQEGVLTQERVNDAVAEPVIYTMDRYVVGGFYRVHAGRGVDEALNAPGSDYVPLAFEHSTLLPQPGVKPGASVPNRFYMYGVVGRLAMLAASYELEATDPEAEIYE
jgi:glutamate--cysteine ligase